MASLRRLAWMCRDLAKQHVDDPDVPAAPDGADGYAEWTQIALILWDSPVRHAHRIVLPKTSIEVRTGVVTYCRSKFA